MKVEEKTFGELAHAITDDKYQSLKLHNIIKEYIMPCSTAPSINSKSSRADTEKVQSETMTLTARIWNDAPKINWLS